jgi:hypothetical protein
MHLLLRAQKSFAGGENMNKKLLGTGLVLVAIGVAILRRPNCNRLCKSIAGILTSAGGSRLVKAFIA